MAQSDKLDQQQNPTEEDHVTRRQFSEQDVFTLHVYS